MMPQLLSGLPTNLQSILDANDFIQPHGFLNTAGNVRARKDRLRCFISGLALLCKVAGTTLVSAARVRYWMRTVEWTGPTIVVCSSGNAGRRTRAALKFAALSNPRSLVVRKARLVIRGRSLVSAVLCRVIDEVTISGDAGAVDAGS